MRGGLEGQTEVSWEEILPPDDVWAPAAASTPECFQPVPPYSYSNAPLAASQFLRQITS